MLFQLKWFERIIYFPIEQKATNLIFWVIIPWDFQGNGQKDFTKKYDYDQMMLKIFPRLSLSDGIVRYPVRYSLNRIEDRYRTGGVFVLPILIGCVFYVNSLETRDMDPDLHWYACPGLESVLEMRIQRPGARKLPKILTNKPGLLTLKNAFVV